jgi:tetratricopeptide (TPR) repeat protein
MARLHARAAHAILAGHGESAMATKKNSWAPFPHEAKAYDLEGDKLKKAWGRLHAGDLEPFPDDKRAAALAKAAGKAAPKGMAEADVAAALQDAWRRFHKGDFQGAFDTGERLGPVGASVAIKAIGIHAAYLVADEAERNARFERAGALAEAAIAALPGEANSHYRYAFAMGRYSQGISIGKALKMGLATKVRAALDKALELEPGHAEAHTALALYHGEIIGKIGALIGGMTYGAKASEADRHMAAALKLTPEAPIVHLEHGNLLLLLHGDRQEDQAAAAYEKAARLKPHDAMERLDADSARSRIE